MTALNLDDNIKVKEGGVRIHDEGRRGTLLEARFLFDDFQRASALRDLILRSVERDVVRPAITDEELLNRLKPLGVTSLCYEVWLGTFKELRQGDTLDTAAVKYLENLAKSTTPVEPPSPQ